MKIKKKIEVEADVTHVLLQLPIRYGTEDIPADFPLRVGDKWTAKVEIDTGRIVDWPAGKSGVFAQKQTDTGTYVLLGADGTEHGRIEENYVPNDLVPGDYGDYVDLQINEQGVITNWPKRPDVSAFFGEAED